MPETPPYEAKLLKQIAAILRKIRALYGNVIDRVTQTADSIIYRGTPFKIADYPYLINFINEELRQLHKGITIELKNGITEAWNLSNEKNNGIVDKRLGGKKPTRKARSILYDPNREALQAFLSRKEKGLNLSQRIWKTVKPFKTQLETALAVGISEGKPAAAMARDIKSYLNEPDRLYRRVRNKAGELELSRAAKNYHPGRGFYRSSYKNALRLTVSETNAGYRMADHERWNVLPFITGFKINLSVSHPERDICDDLNVGIYPKDFVWKGWHPFCLCYKTPVFASDKDYSKLEDVILGLSDDVPDIKQTTELPKSFTKYMEKNGERIAGWKSQPYWLADNKAYVEK